MTHEASGKLLELAAICEAATKASAELDARIRCAVYAPNSAQVEQSKINGAWVVYDGVEHRSGRQRVWEGPGRMQPFTASLDAAMTLVDSRALWSHGRMEDGPFAHLCWPMPNGSYLGGYFDGKAATVPLAICVAALRARAHTLSGDQ